MTKEERLLACLQLQFRILRNIDIDPVSGCWLWRGRKNNKGYAVMSVWLEGRAVKVFVHRASWEAFRFRRMPKGRVGAHGISCSARHCVNWLHVRATTQSHNERDKVRVRRKKKWGGRYRTEFPPTHTVIRKRTKRENRERRIARRAASVG